MGSFLRCGHPVQPGQLQAALIFLCLVDGNLDSVVAYIEMPEIYCKITVLQWSEFIVHESSPVCSPRGSFFHQKYIGEGHVYIFGLGCDNYSLKARDSGQWWVGEQVLMSRTGAPEGQRSGNGTWPPEAVDVVCLREGWAGMMMAWPTGILVMVL